MVECVLQKLTNRSNEVCVCIHKIQFSVKAPNLALNKNATQPTTIPRKDASLAVDGRRDAKKGTANTCAAQRLQRSPWWQVDLGGMRRVEEVVVTRKACKRQCHSK